ncbi:MULTISPECIES: hypothetical protein [Erysipelotrichaceae]|uniref:Uncharacterized protein n=1 Tax=[Eubacterium] hominis TaxID=2764325 RepID=A0A7G9GNN8_9FIRM|nr:hypothetical protein [Absiella sp. AM27-20]QNM12420.1 hypothetical protein H9Q80_00240 [[Eubacterium] hominis]RHU10665.1 hypothetical protein DW716_01200 [Absiella sp. AM27-20]
MLNDYFWVCKTHYDIKTGREPILEVVKGETFTYRHCGFGVYFDEDTNLWRLIDLDTGLQYAESPSRIRVLSRLWVGPLFGEYLNKRDSPYYADLRDKLEMEVDHLRELTVKNCALRLSDEEMKACFMYPQDGAYFPMSWLSAREVDMVIYEKQRKSRGCYS